MTKIFGLLAFAELGLIAAVGSIALSTSRQATPPAPDIPMADMKAFLIDAFRRNRDLDTAYLSAAPDSILAWAPTAGVRTYGQQVAHITHDFFQFWRDDYALPDSSVYHDRSALLRELTGGYGWAITRVESMSEESLGEIVDVTAGIRAPRWRVMIYWLDHAVWTRGSLVPYLRLNGIRPPPARFW